MSWGFERQHYLPLGVIMSTTLDPHEENSASAGKWSADTSTIKTRFAAMLLVLFYEEWQHHQGRVTVASGLKLSATLEIPLQRQEKRWP